MKINLTQITRSTVLKTAGIISAALVTPALINKTYAVTPENDVFVSADSLITPKGISADSAKISYPSPVINVGGNEINAAVIVDLNKNILYKYDEFGKPKTAYLVASGKKSTPTKPCIKRVTHIENYPYSTAPETTKRRNAPSDYGPRVICLEIIDKNSGAVSGVDGQFIHGNHDESSLGKYASLGCVRMDNNAVKELSLGLKRGDYVVFMR